MFTVHSFHGSLTVCFMRCVGISYMFWLFYMMPAIRVIGQKTARATHRNSYFPSREIIVSHLGQLD